MKTTKKRRSGGGLMHSSGVKIAYDGREIKCEICGGGSFSLNGVSVKRSKLFGIVLYDSTVFSHPLRMYTCENCSNCKFVYQSNRINNLSQKIISSKDKAWGNAPVSRTEP